MLELLATEGKSEDVIKMHKYVEGLARQAREAVDNVERERSEESGIGTCPMETMKRNGGERESVEEFLMRIECISANCGVVNDLALADPDFGAPELNEAILI